MPDTQGEFIPVFKIYARYNGISISDNSKNIRLFTGIHALKPKPKLKSGAISEPAALNVEQTNTSAKCADQKAAITGGAPPLPSPLAPKPENGQDQSAAMLSSAEIGVSGSKAAPATLKKEAALTKVPADKKKIDARKKSLKRL